MSDGAEQVNYRLNCFCINLVDELWEVLKRNDNWCVMMLIVFCANDSGFDFGLSGVA